MAECTILEAPYVCGLNIHLKEDECKTEIP